MIDRQVSARSVVVAVCALTAAALVIASWGFAQPALGAAGVCIAIVGSTLIIVGATERSAQREISAFQLGRDSAGVRPIKH